MCKRIKSVAPISKSKPNLHKPKTLNSDDVEHPTTETRIPQLQKIKSHTQKQKLKTLQNQRENRRVTGSSTGSGDEDGAETRIRHCNDWKRTHTAPPETLLGSERNGRGNGLKRKRERWEWRSRIEFMMTLMKGQWWWRRGRVWGGVEWWDTC